MLQYAAYRTLYNYRLFFNAGLGLRTFFFPLGTPPGKAFPALLFLVGMLYYHRYEGDKQQYGSAAGRVENDGVYAGATAVFGLLRRLLHTGSGRGLRGQLGLTGLAGITA